MDVPQMFAGVKSARTRSLRLCAMWGLAPRMQMGRPRVGTWLINLISVDTFSALIRSPPERTGPSTTHGRSPRTPAQGREMHEGDLIDVLCLRHACLSRVHSDR